MIRFNAYVKFSIEGELFALQESYAQTAPSGQAENVRRRASLLENAARLVDFASALPKLPERLFGVMFPSLRKDGGISLLVRPVTAAQVVDVLDVLPSCPLAHLPGRRQVSPLVRGLGMMRVFPYTFAVQVKPRPLCMVEWFHEHGPGETVPVVMQLRRELAEEAINMTSGEPDARLFVKGLVPYVYVRSTDTGAQKGIHFPRAYLKEENEESSRLLGWRDVPLFAEFAERTTPANACVLTGVD